MDDAGAARLGRWGDRLIAQWADSYADLCAGVNPQQVEDALEEKPRALVWLGHGRRDALTISGAQAVTSTNIGAMVGSTVIAIACLAGEDLAKVATEELGVRGFLGFARILSWSSHAPELFGEALVRGLSCLFTAGHDLACAARQLNAHFDEVAAFFFEEAERTGFQDGSGHPSEAMLAYFGALGNRDGLRVVGSGDATL